MSLPSVQKKNKKKLQSFEKKIVKRERDLFLLLVIIIIMPLLSHLRQQTSSECASSTSFVVSKKKKNGGGRNGKGTEGVLMRVFGAFEKKKKKKLTRGFLGKRYGRYDDDDGIHNGVYVARMMMARGRGHLHVVRAKQTTELERDRLDIEISSTWDESMEDDFEFDEDGQLLDAFGEEIDTTEVKKAIPGDFYSLIQVPKDASSAEIKKAYRRLQKACHPDIAGEAGSDVCIILNEAYDILMDDTARAAYDAEMKELERMTQEYMKRGAADEEDDEGGGYTGEPLSEFKGKDPAIGYPRAVFVNECQCIGCKQCCHSAPKTFAMDDQFGRARVFAQWDDEEEDINIAIESCPVDCIHFVKENNLPILEYAMSKCERTSVASMMSGSARVDDPFDVANQMIRRGEERYGRLGLDPNEALKGKSLVGRMKKRIRDAWLQLGEKPRLAWTSYKIFRGFGSEDEEYDVSVDDFGEVRRKKTDEEEKKTKKSRWFNFN